MKRTYKILILFLVVIVIISVVASYFLVIQDKEMSLSDIEAIQLNPGDDYIQRLEETVNTSGDAYIRERALLALTDITIRKNETDEIVDFLKNIAINEEEDNVMSAAYASLDLIREIYPPDWYGTLELHLVGDIKKHGNVTLIATIGCTVDAEALVGIDKLHINMEPITDPVKKVQLVANTPQQIEFELHVKDVGEYFVPVTLILGIDIVDYETISKTIYIDVHEDFGEVLVLEDG